MLIERASVCLAALAVSATWSCASSQVANPEEQIAQALAAAPEDKAEGARVLGYATDGSVVELRPGSNDFVCLASNPANERFSSSCYHASLEPYFARGRELDAEGADRNDRYGIRYEEMEAGTLSMPVMSATQYILDGTWNFRDPNCHRDGALGDLRPRRHAGVDRAFGAPPGRGTVDHVPGHARCPHHDHAPARRIARRPTARR